MTRMQSSYYPLRGPKHPSYQIVFANSGSKFVELEYLKYLGTEVLILRNHKSPSKSRTMDGWKQLTLWKYRLHFLNWTLEFPNGF